MKIITCGLLLLTSSSAMASSDCIDKKSGYTVEFRNRKALVYLNNKLLVTYKKDPREETPEDRNAYDSYGNGALVDKSDYRGPVSGPTVEIDDDQTNLHVTVRCK